MTTTKEQERFRAKMIEEVLGNDNNGKVPMEKVVLIIWQFRDDPQVVKFMTRFVAKVRFFFVYHFICLMFLLLGCFVFDMYFFVYLFV